MTEPDNAKGGAMALADRLGDRVKMVLLPEDPRVHLSFKQPDGSSHVEALTRRELLDLIELLEGAPRTLD
jgi:hypothetical protein